MSEPELSITQVRAAYVASVRLSTILEQLQRITSTPAAPQHPHAGKVKAVLDEWLAECLKRGSRYIIAEGQNTERA